MSPRLENYVSGSDNSRKDYYFFVYLNKWLRVRESEKNGSGTCFSLQWLVDAWTLGSYG